MNQHSLFTMEQLSNEDIFSVLNDARLMNRDFKDWQLPVQNARVANLFFEPSTRTHFSFESAQMQLGCRIADFQAETSSVAKGETLYDTVKTFEMIGYQCLVIRHTQDEYYKELEGINIPIINAGDGAGNHPTQCLLDLMTMQEEFGTLSGLNVAIVGDILHSRVAASNKT
ncbi:MAG: aspartate carbamoyltransferase, partial [Erysipelotrichaceae bacterium]|nr:aspartate carbamoyltransferase [Erysipelotrichaceae bacterium]